MSIRNFRPNEVPWSFTIDRHRFRLAPPTVTRADPHTVDPVPFLAPQYSTSPAQISYADVNRSVEIPVAQNDFSGGLAKKLEYGADNATQFRYSKNLDTSGPAGTVYPGPKVTGLGGTIATVPNKAVQKGNITYVAAGINLYQITDLSTLTLDKVFADAITDLIVWNDKIVVGFGEAAATNMQYRVSDTIAAAFTDVGVKADFFAIVQNNPIGPVFYRCIATSRQIAAATDVLATSVWVSFAIGDSQSAITSLTAHGDHLIVGKSVGPYAFTTDYISYPIIDRSIQLENYASVAKAAISWRGQYVFTGKHSVYAWNSSSITSIGFDLLADPGIPAGSYRPDAFTADPHFLYASIAQTFSPGPTGGVYIWKTADGRTWHNYLWRSDLGQATELLFATNKLGSVSQNAVLFAYKSGGNYQLAWAPWPATVDPAKDSAYTFDTTFASSLRTCDYTGNLATVTKYTDRVKNVADNLAITAPVSLYAYLDATAALKLATFEQSPFQDADLLKGQTFLKASLEWRLTGSTTTSATQQLHGFEFPIRFHSRVVNRHTVHLIAADDQPLVSGGQVSPRGSYATQGYWKSIVEDLREIRQTQISVDCTDEDGTKFKAYLVDIAQRTAHPRDGGDPTKVLTLSLLEVVPV